MRGTRLIGGLIALLGLIGTASGDSITQVSHTCGPETCCPSGAEKCCQPAPGCQPRSCRPACCHSQFWRDLGKKCHSNRGCCKQDCCGNHDSKGCCAPASCCPAPSINTCCPSPAAAQSCCPAPAPAGCCPKPCCAQKPSCTPNKGFSLHWPKAWSPKPKCCEPKCCPEPKGVCSVRVPKQTCCKEKCSKEKVCKEKVCKEKVCKEKQCKEKRPKYCKADCDRIAHLIYVSQVGCSAKIRRKAVDKLGECNCSCHPEIMSALVYALNDCDAAVRKEAADEIGDQFEDSEEYCADQTVIDALIVTLSDCHPAVVKQAEEALRNAGYSLRDCYRECDRAYSSTGQDTKGLETVNNKVGRAVVSTKGSVTLGKPETAGVSYNFTPSVTSNAGPITTSVSVDVHQDSPAAPKTTEEGTDEMPPIPGPMPDANPGSVDPETYFPTRVPDQQTRKAKNRSQLANLFGLR